MRPADVPAAQAVGHESLREAGTRYGWTTPERDAAAVERGERQTAHMLRTDPDGAWVAEAAGELVGVAFALRRGPLWYLALLTVLPGRQGQGVGGRLLEATLRTAADAPAGLIMSSSDPKALRRYGRAGFALLPGYDATGPVDRALLPAVPEVSEGDWDRDGERLDDLGRRLRGAAYGPDLAAYRDGGARLLVADGGVAVFRATGLSLLAADDPGTAQSLLWAALAEADGDVEIGPLTGTQQWAVEVALAARLSLVPGTSLCTRGAIGPLTPYLPGGAFG